MSTQALNKRILHLQIQHMVDYTLPSALLSPVYGAVLAYAIANPSNQQFLTIWVMLLVVTSGVWYAIMHFYQHQKITDRQFVHLATISGLIGGLIWGGCRDHSHCGK